MISTCQGKQHQKKTKNKRDITTQMEINKERQYTTIPDTSKNKTQIDRNNTQVEKRDLTESDKEITRDTKKHNHNRYRNNWKYIER